MLFSVYSKLSIKYIKCTFYEWIQLIHNSTVIEEKGEFNKLQYNWWLPNTYIRCDYANIFIYYIYDHVEFCYKWRLT